MRLVSLRAACTSGVQDGVFGAGSAIRPGPLQRADALGLMRQLLSMDDEDAEGLESETVGEDRTRGNGR